MGIEYKKLPDVDEWIGDKGYWRIEIKQDENGDWRWDIHDTNWKGPVLEMKGVRPTQKQAQWAAEQWIQRLSVTI